MSEPISTEEDPDPLYHPKEGTEWEYTNVTLPARVGGGFVGEPWFPTEDTSAGRQMFPCTIVRHDDGRRVCVQHSTISLS